MAMAAIKPTIVQRSSHPVPKYCESWKESVFWGVFVGYDREKKGITYVRTHDGTPAVFIVEGTSCSI